jgi:hypothetical protein
VIFAGADCVGAGDPYSFVGKTDFFAPHVACHGLSDMGNRLK